MEYPVVLSVRGIHQVTYQVTLHLCPGVSATSSHVTNHCTLVCPPLPVILLLVIRQVTLSVPQDFITAQGLRIQQTASIMSVHGMKEEKGQKFWEISLIIRGLFVKIFLFILPARGGRQRSAPSRGR